MSLYLYIYVSMYVYIYIYLYVYMYVCMYACIYVCWYDRCFKFMALYSSIQFITVLRLYQVNTNMSDMQYLWIDLCLIFPLAVTMGRTHAYNKLSRYKPNGRLISFPVFPSPSPVWPWRCSVSLARARCSVSRSLQSGMLCGFCAGILCGCTHVF